MLRLLHLLQLRQYNNLGKLHFQNCFYAFEDSKKRKNAYSLEYHSAKIFFLHISSYIFSILSMHHIILYIAPWKSFLCKTGSIFWSKTFPKTMFFPLTQYVTFQLLLCPFCFNSSIICIYFTLLLRIFSFSFPFLPSSFTFSPSSLPFFTFSPPNDIG